MRIMAVAAAAVALSGCSWLGGWSSTDTTTSDNCCGKFSRWNAEASIGPEFNVGGDLLRGITATNPGNGRQITTGSLSMDDAFDPGYSGSLGVSYAATPNVKLTAAGTYTRMNGVRSTIGTDLRPSGVTVPFDVHPTDYEAWGAELGLRKYFQPKKIAGAKLRPYVGATAGAMQVDDINLRTISSTASGATLQQNVQIFEESWVPTGSLIAGFEWHAGLNSTLGLETGIRYTGELDAVDGDINATFPELAGIQDSGERWSVPVMLRGRYRF